MDALDDMMERFLAEEWTGGKWASPVALHVDPVAEAADTAEPVSDDLGYAEGQSFIIEYLDSRGTYSRRRITVYHITPGRRGVPTLRARCHERGVNREFRVDRIKAVYDYDGVVYDDVPAFLQETFGMSLAAATRQEAPEVKRTPAPVVSLPVKPGRPRKDEYSDDELWQRVRTACRYHAVLLSALSQSDGRMDEAEVVIAVEHCIWMAERAGYRANGDTVDRLARYICRQTPTRDVVLQACDELRDEPADVVIALLSAGVRLVEADGVLCKEEVALLDRIAVELTGLPLQHE